MAQLVERSGVPLATIKYYLREGVLMPGRAVSVTTAEYDDVHVRRLALVKALAGVGLTLPRIKVVLALVDEPTRGLYETLGAALAQLPPYLDDVELAGPHPRARAALEHLGMDYDPRYVAVAQLERALAAAEDAGVPMTPDRLDSYGLHSRAIAKTDLDLMPRGGLESAIRYSVVGTTVHEPVLAALRRLAHGELALRLFAQASSRPAHGSDEHDSTRPGGHHQEDEQ
nr:MerR family transcriptional regulator [Rhodococcus sp. HNM0569]